jgi:hypothetical protein
MKKIIYLAFMSVILLTACTEDDTLSDQGIKLEELPAYVAFSVNGVGKNLATITLNEGVTTASRINVEIPTGSVSNVTVNYTFSGTAVYGVDFIVAGATSQGGSVIIVKPTTPNVNALPDNADIVVTLLTDGVVDGNKTLAITLDSAFNADGPIAVGRGGTDLLKTANVVITDID